MNVLQNDLVAVQKALQSPDTMATTINAIVRATFGEEAYTWDPSSIYLELKAEYGVDPDAAVIDRYAAMGIVMLSDSFFKRLDAFCSISNTFNTGEPFFQIFDPPSVEESAWSIVEVAINRELLPFSYPVRKYLRIILQKDGFTEDEFP